MKIVKLEKDHLIEASRLACENYKEEYASVSALPKIEQIPDLKWITENSYGVAAMEGEKLLGFIGCYNPWDNAFDSNARGTFTPLHAHGCVQENRTQIYQRMYQKMADLLVNDGVLYHAIALYEHDEKAVNAYFRNGFGQRCADAIRRMEKINDTKPSKGIVYEEITSSDAKYIRELRRELTKHLGESSCFMYTTSDEFEVWVKEREKENNRIFVAKDYEMPIAFIEIRDEGENFIPQLPKIKNICGAFCLPQYRGQMIMQNLLNHLIEILKKEGYEYLGVDYESFNPTAYQFWTKYFEPYTCSVTRRIDEGILKKEI